MGVKLQNEQDTEPMTQDQYNKECKSQFLQLTVLNVCLTAASIIFKYFRERGEQ